MRRATTGRRWARTASALVVAAGIWLATGTSAAAHDLSLTDATLVVRTDRSWTLDLVVDVDALALGVGSQAPAAEVAARLLALGEEDRAGALERAAGTLGRRVRVLVDGAALDGRLSFPDRGRGEVRGQPTVFGLVARFDGELPEAASAISVRLSRGLPPMVLTVLDGIALASGREAVEQGGESTPWLIGAARQAAGAGASPQWPQYLRLGILHIVPRGLDHVLFVLGLFLLAPRLGPLLWQVSAFTLAHTITLGLATLGHVSLPSWIVESAIAASIAWVGLDAALRAWRGVAIEVGLARRVAVVFAFGLLHGLGFAGVLGEVGLPPGELLEALVGFNVGVELGQVLVLGAALAVFGPWRERRWYPRVVVVPMGVAIVAAGSYWMVERLLA